MDHFLEISSLSGQQIKRLIDRAFEFKNSQRIPAYPHAVVANLFYENSTRTRVSFELAAKHLGMKVINLEVHSSSEAKGETLEDTVENLAAMGIRYFVIRHQQEGIQQALADKIPGIHLINAGDGTHAHPSQALLDMMTIVEAKLEVASLKIAVLGNIRHSRVANSFQAMCAHYNVRDLVMIAPPSWQPQKIQYGRVTTDIKEGLADADVVMALRVQRERLLQHEHLDLPTYRREFALTPNTLAYAKPQAIVMHPGPINRGVEIDSSVADGVQSVLLKQVTNGVYARMAVLDALITQS